MTIQVESVILGQNAELLPSQNGNILEVDSLILNDVNKNELSTILKQHKDITYGYIRLNYNGESIFNEDFRDYLVLRWVITIDWLEDYLIHGEANMIEPAGISIKKDKENSILFFNANDNKELLIPEFDFIENILSTGKYFFQLFINYTKISTYDNYLIKIDKLLELI